MEHRALGKGLSALIPEKGDSKKGDAVTYLKTETIKNNRLQPRTNYNSEKLSELIASIKEKGVLQPILVREKEGQYEVIAGERRLRAARALNMEEVPVIIKSVTDQEALVLALVENLQREELNAIEEAEAFKKLTEDFKYSHDEVAQSIGKDRSTISNTLRLLKLPTEIQKSIASGDLSVGHARALLSIENISEQKRLFSLATKKGLSVRELENFVKAETKAGARREKVKTSKPYEILALEEVLQKFLGTKVRIAAQKKRGRIEIEYYSLDDLKRILNLIKK